MERCPPGCEVWGIILRVRMSVKCERSLGGTRDGCGGVQGSSWARREVVDEVCSVIWT